MLRWHTKRDGWFTKYIHASRASGTKEAISSPWIWKGVSATLQVADTPFHIQGDDYNFLGETNH